MRKSLIALGLSMVLWTGVIASAGEPTLYKPLEPQEFTRITPKPIPPIILEPREVIIRTRPEIKVVDPKSKVELKSTPKPKVITRRTSHSITGKASWYCKAGVSICHHSYPPGSMVAAACGDLRRAMGSNWRGKTVAVQHGITIYVKLVDWCGSEDKLIDLYWAPMHKLGGTGVLHVKVSW